MSRWRIGSIGETDICIHPVMPVCLLYAFITGHGLFMALSTVSILLHEATHAFTAAIFGQSPHCIELTPLGAVMRLEDEARLPCIKRAGMLLAGPAMTLLLCWSSLLFTKKGMLSVEIGRILFLSNLSILMLNLLPALPLDGGRLLSLLLERFAPLQLVHRIMRGIGSLLGISMILLNIYATWNLGGWNLSLAFAGCCLMYSAITATTSQALAELRHFVDRKIAFERRGRLAISWIAVSSAMPLRNLLRLLPAGKMAMFSGFEIGSMKSCGWLTENEVIQQYLRKPDARFSETVKMYPERLNSAQNSTI